MLGVGAKVQVEIAEIDSRGKLSLIPVIEGEERRGRQEGRHRQVTSTQLHGDGPHLFGGAGRRPYPNPAQGQQRHRHGPQDHPPRRPAHRHRDPALRPLRDLRHLGPRRLPRRDAGPERRHALPGAPALQGHAQRRSALDISSAIDAVGGEMNAFTAKEYTCYYARVLDTDLPLAIDVVCDMLTGSLILDEDVDVERGVILEEIAMTEDDPGDCVHDLFAHTMLGDTPLGRPVLGTVDTVNALTADRIAPLLQEALRPDPPGRRRRRQRRPRQGRTPGPRGLREGRRPQAAPTPRRSPRATAAARLAHRRPRRAARPQDRAGPRRPRHAGPGPHRRAPLGTRRAQHGPRRRHDAPASSRRSGRSAASPTACTRTPPASPTAASSACTRAAGPSQVHDVLKICRDELDHVAEHGLSDEEIGRAIGQLARFDRPRPGGHGRADEPYRQERAVLGRPDVRRRHAGPDRRGHPGRRSVRSPARSWDSAPRCRSSARSRTSRRPVCTKRSPDGRTRSTPAIRPVRKQER